MSLGGIGEWGYLINRMSRYMWHLDSGLQKDLGWSLGMQEEIREVASLVCLLPLLPALPRVPSQGLGWGDVCGVGENVAGGSTRLAEAPWLRTTLPVAHYELIFLINPVIIL